jgi:hypothetical protein
VRRYWQTEKIQWFADRKEWEGLRSVGVVESRFYLSSLPTDVENQLHWVLDVVFGEDQSRARTGNAAENLAATCRLAINLLRRDKTCKRSVKGKLLRAAIDPVYLKFILSA